jgi:hypothetical protein
MAPVPSQSHVAQMWPRTWLIRATEGRDMTGGKSELSRETTS